MKGGSLIAAMLVAGCTVGPTYHPPEATPPKSYPELPISKDQAPLSMPVAGEADLSHWWLQFGDVELQNLIGRALESNLDLLTAASRVREARQQEIIAGAAGLPQISASGLGTGVRAGSSILPGMGGTPAQPALVKGPVDAALFSAGFDASWEIDLFGGNSRAVEAAQAGTEAAIWRMRDGEVALTGEVATDYIALRATQERVAILRAETQAQQDLLELMKARAGAGFVTQLEVNQQSSLTDSTVARIPELQGNARALEHAIGVLLAEQSDAISSQIDNNGVIPSIPPVLPIGLPSELLRRRPDVRAAERQLAGATAQVGIAVADLYPKFNLIGAAGLAGGSVANLASGTGLAQFGLGSISWPIFHWGQSQANVHVREEEAKQAYYAYQKTVLVAVQNVQDALSRYTTEQQRIVALERAEASAKSSIAIATQQFRAGTVTYVNVLVAQGNELSVRDQLVQSREAFAIDLISLFKALGGGWDAQTEAPMDKGDNDVIGTDLETLVENPVHGVTQGKAAVHAVPKVSSEAASATLSSADHAGRDGLQIQLGAWRTEAAAKAGWDKATRQAGGVLKGLIPGIAAADLPGKGRYYRLRIKLTSGVSSFGLCQALVAKGLACLSVRD